jgi:hypothetical protein
MRMSRWSIYICAAAVSAGILFGLSAIIPASATPAPLWAEKAEKKAKAQKLPKGADPQFYAAIQEARKRGVRRQVPDYIGHDLGLVNVNMPRLWALYLSSTDYMHAIWVIDELANDTVLLMSQASGQPLVYVTNPTGALKKAAVVTTGRMSSYTLRSVSVTGLEDAFKVEQEFWMKAMASADAVDSNLADPAK